MLYPANAKKDCAKEQYKIKEIHVMNLKDIQNNGKYYLDNTDCYFFLTQCRLKRKWCTRQNQMLPPLK